MTRQPEKRAIRIIDVGLALAWQIVARTNKTAGPAMLETAVAVAGCVYQEQVAIQVGWRAEERQLRLAQDFQVVTQSRHIELRLATNRNRMRNSKRFEFTDGELRHFNRVIDQLPVVRRLVLTVSVLFRAA